MEFDVVIVGSGVAGNTTGYYLAKSGFRVAIINKNEAIEESNTFYAQGGISYEGDGDSAKIRYDDIMTAGANICNPTAVEIVSTEGPDAIRQALIKDFQVDFSKNSNGDFDITDEGAHSVKRILHSFDTTGKSIEEASLAALHKLPNITFLNSHTVVDIITWEHHAVDKYRMYKPPTALGVYVLNNNTQKIEKLLAKVTIIATGGLGQLYLHSTNPSSSTGDGYAMAARAGTWLINMEYTQFHPTTLYLQNSNNFLISEAVRGEGGVIVDKQGVAFMDKYHELKSLAPRDIVTRAILTEMLESDDEYVYLDVSNIGADKIKSRFPHIYKTCLQFGLDITHGAIPIVPAFHFSCGGIRTDMYGKTNLNRLFAVGEAACTGLHGANRLASTSLLEGVVFGQRIAKYIAENRNDYLNCDFPSIPEWIDTGIIDTVDPALINQDWNSLQSIMWNYVGAIRSKRRLRRAISDLKNLRDEIESFYRDTKVNRKLTELRNAVQTGLIVAYQAWANRESIGAHYRID